MMALKLISPPAYEPISLEEAKLHCKVETDDDDLLLESLIVAAREYCEGFQRRAYISQIWELWLDAFPDADYIELPRPPLKDIESILYYGTDDTEFEFEDFFVDSKSEPGRAMLNHDASWPSATLRPANGICITFIAGYGEIEEEYGEEEYDTSAIPQKVKQAILLLIGHWYENREAIASTGAIPKEIPLSVEALLWMDRNF